MLRTHSAQQQQIGLAAGSGGSLRSSPTVDTPVNPPREPDAPGMTGDPYAAAAASAARLAELTVRPRHDIAVVLGSGWALAADAFSVSCSRKRC